MTTTTTALPAPGKLQLRDYQRDAISAVRDGFGRGVRRQLIELPTGTGKTVVFASIPGRVKKKTLIIAHRSELLDQARDKLAAANPDLRIEIEQADRHADQSADVIIASIQTLATSPGRLQAFNPADYSIVVVDEAHHAVARTYVETFAHFGLAPDIEGLRDNDLTRREMRADIKAAFEEFSPAPDTPVLLGVTATSGRTDGRGLAAMFDEIVFHRTIKDMMLAGWLARVRGLRIGSGVSLEGVKTRAGDFAERELAEAVNLVERNKLAVSAYQEHATGRQAIAFAVDVAHATALCDEFLAAGIRAATVFGETPKLQRADTIARYRTGEINVLVNCMVLTEGFDAPETSCIVMTRPTKSSLLYTQMLGRGTRLAEGKEDLLILDIVDIAKAGIASLNTLFGLPPKFDMTGLGELADVIDAQRAVEGFNDLPEDVVAEATSVSDLDAAAKEFDPLAPAVLPDYLRTTMAWYRTPYGYAIQTGDREQVGVVEDQLGHATAAFRGPGQQAIEIGRYASVQGAIEDAEGWIREHRGEQMQLLRADARWRKLEPTEKQLKTARQLKIKVPESATRGIISQLISRKKGERNGDR